MVSPSRRDAITSFQGIVVLPAILALSLIHRSPPTGSKEGEASSQAPHCGARATLPCLATGSYSSIAAGLEHTCAIGFDQKTYCWGDGNGGALGDGKSQISATPHRVDGTLRFTALAAGGGYSCGLAEDRTVYCWGRAQPVPGFPKPKPTPQPVSGLADVRSIAAGRRHMCALDAAGGLYCWGFNVDGEGGNGTSGIAASVLTVPTRVLAQTTFRAVSAGLDFSCALSTEGEPFCWGSNVDGVLGKTAPEKCGDVSPVPCASRPMRIESDQRFVSIAAGASHVCALTADGRVYCWGSNGRGQLGSFGPRHVGSYYTPRYVPLDDEISQISAGAAHTCARSLGGSLWCWGADATSQLGAFRNSDVQWGPVESQPRLSFVTVAAGGYHTCGLTERGDAYCWGDNDHGALGAP